MTEIILNGDAGLMPAEIEVNDIAEEALQAAFKVIADRLALDGYPVTGDFMPHEVRQMDNVFQGFVRSMAGNNDDIAALREEWDES